MTLTTKSDLQSEAQEGTRLQCLPWGSDSRALSGLVWCSNILEMMIQPVVCLNLCKGAPSNILFPAVSKVNMHKIQILHKTVPSFALLNYSLFSKVFIMSFL